MLVRRKLQRVGEEAFISGLDQNLLPSVILLDARMRQMDVGGRLELNLRARWPSGGAVTNMQTQTHLDKLEQSAQSLADAAAALLALPPPAAAVPELTPDEITLLARRTETLLASRSWTEAQESAEALIPAPTRRTTGSCCSWRWTRCRRTCASGWAKRRSLMKAPCSG